MREATREGVRAGTGRRIKVPPPMPPTKGTIFATGEMEKWGRSVNVGAPPGVRANPEEECKACAPPTCREREYTQGGAEERVAREHLISTAEEEGVREAALEAAKKLESAEKVGEEASRDTPLQGA